MYFKSSCVRVLQVITITTTLVYILVQYINPIYNQRSLRNTAKDHQIPYSFRRVARHNYEAIIARVIYKATWLQYECQYFLSLIVQNYKSLSPITQHTLIAFRRLEPGYSRQVTAHNVTDQALLNNEEYKKEMNKLFMTLNVHQYNIAEAIIQQCVLESMRMNKMAKHFVSTQLLQWYRLIYQWNKPLLLTEGEQPFHYRKTPYQQKLAQLTLRHTTRMMSLKMHDLYQLHERQIQALDLSTCCTHDDKDPSYDSIVEFFNNVRLHRNYYLKKQMHTTLIDIKNALKLNLERSFKALNESIFIEKGKYHHTLHPENQYILVIDEHNWRSLIQVIDQMWDGAFVSIKKSWSPLDWLKWLLDTTYASIQYFKQIMLKSIKQVLG